MRKRLWRLGVVAVIALAGAVILPSPASAATNLVRVVEWTASDASDSKSVTAHCPANTRVVGGGAEIVGASMTVHITGMQPNGTSNTYTVFAREHRTTDWAWQLKAQAVCAPDSLDVSYVQEVTGGDSSYSNSDYAFCPLGTKVLGVGARVTANDTSKVFPTYIKPTGTGNGAEAGAVEMEGGYSGNWSLYTWAICAPAPSGWELVVDAGEPQGAYAGFTCPSSKKLTGAGAYISLSLGRIFLVDVSVSNAPGSTSIPDGVDLTASYLDSPYTHDWYVKAYGICVS